MSIAYAANLGNIDIVTLLLLNGAHISNKVDVSETMFFSSMNNFCIIILLFHFFFQF